MSYIMGTYKRFPITIKYGKDVYLFDENDNKYLDFVGGIATNCLGYSNSNYKEALKRQIDELMHCSNLYSTKINEECAKNLVNQTELDKVFFVNSGTEATEAALKLARIYSKNVYGKEKFEIISMKNSFHGRTLGSLTLTGQTKYQEDFIPLIGGVRYANFNDVESLKSIKTDNTCAVILEMIQGEGGIITAEKDYVKAVRNYCDENDLLLIIDEVQSGVGRTGKFYAYQNYDIIPDMVASAKGLGGGFPCGCLLAKKEVAKYFTYGKHGTTFGGNPMASTAINAVITNMVNLNILDNVNLVSKYLFNKLDDLKKKHSIICEIRGIGLMIGIAFVDSFPISDIIKSCMDSGLLLVGAGSHTIRMVPPLIIKKEHVDEAIKILDNVISEVKR